MLSPLMFLSMMLIGDSRFIFRGRVGRRQVERPTFARAAWLLFRKLAGISVLLGIAFVLRPAVAVVAVTVIAGLVAGATVSIIFQVQHVVEGTVWPVRDPETNDLAQEWAVIQAESSADFGLSNRLLTWYSGALNFHIEHHLFPRIPHTRLPEVCDIVRATCAQYGVQRVEFPTLTAAVRSHARFLRRMGRPPEQIPEQPSRTLPRRARSSAGRNHVH
jgi:linoleoyl-CoA desaturase